MLNEYQINMLPERIYQRLSKMNTEYLTSIGEVIKKIGELRPTDVHRLQQMYNYGADLQKVSLKLAEVTRKNTQEIYDIFDIVAKDNYNFAKPFYKAKAIQFIPYEENESLQKYVKAIAKQTAGEYVNLTQHTAFSVFAKDGKSIAPLFASNKHKVATSLSDTYTKVVDYAVSKVQLGGESYNKAMKDVIKALASSGIRTVDYATGYSRRLDSAVRQNILWGIKECNQNTADMVGKEFGADGYEISYHSNPRPSHAEMGGKRYAIGKARIVNGVYYPSFSDVEDLLKEYGCLHFKFSILLGVSQPAYNSELLEGFKFEDNRLFTFEGKLYTRYEAIQLQGRIESAIRHQKVLANIAKAAGNDELRREAQYKINILLSKYVKLSQNTGLPTRLERTAVSGYRPVKVKKKEKSKVTHKLVKASIIKAQGDLLDKIMAQLGDEMLDKVTEKLGEKMLEKAAIAQGQFGKKAILLASDEEVSSFTSVAKGMDSEYIANKKYEGVYVKYSDVKNEGYSIDDILFMLSNDKVKSIVIIRDDKIVETLSKTRFYNKTTLKRDLEEILEHNVHSYTDEEYATAVKILLKKHSKKGGMLEWNRSDK